MALLNNTLLIIVGRGGGGGSAGKTIHRRGPWSSNRELMAQGVVGQEGLVDIWVTPITALLTLM